ncbi:MAG TPA: carboxylating nicotinate-nucleotide diphosphorylase [Egibacteraceae bacterium]|nr:carboxylating nicotinate-nucleotide diphosphorylase [Egibacteraceae bacterium]
MTATSLHGLIAAAVAEDLGASGDVTAAATVPPAAQAAADFVTRERGVIAGLDAVEATLRAVDPSVSLERRADDGDAVVAGAVVARCEGSARGILAAERTALNLLCHLSGVATETARYVDAVAGSGCAIRDTRKTLPGLRALQKAAVVAGGGKNHRMSLSDGLLVKDNHVVAAGGVGQATRLALDAADGLGVQIEVDSLAELDEALDAGATSVLLDNFSVGDMRAAVERCRQSGDVFVEVSGGVTLASVREVALTGVDAVAVGALTHSARALDIGLDFVTALAARNGGR